MQHPGIRCEGRGKPRLVYLAVYPLLVPAFQAEGQCRRPKGRTLVGTGASDNWRSGPKAGGGDPRRVGLDLRNGQCVAQSVGETTGTEPPVGHKGTVADGPGPLLHTQPGALIAAIVDDPVSVREAVVAGPVAPVVHLTGADEGGHATRRHGSHARV